MSASARSSLVRPLPLAFGLGLLLAPLAPAQIALGGYVFDAQAAPDVATPQPGSQPQFAMPASGCASVTSVPGLTLQQAATAVFVDGDADEWISGKSRVQLDFTDNCVINGPGPDLVVFEVGGAESFALQVFSDAICEYSGAITFAVAATGSTVAPCGGTPNALNAVAIDLDAFGVLPGASVRRVLLDNLGQPAGAVGADLVGLYALNSGSPQDLSSPCLLAWQQGVDAGAGAFAGAVDTCIASDFPTTNLSAVALEYVDGSPERSLLLRFDGLVGAGAGQIPPGAAIAKASLILCAGPGAADGSNGTHAVHRLLQPWNAATLNWASGFGGDGLDADGVEATAAVVATVPATGANATLSLDVTAAVQAWADGAPNHGLALLSSHVDALGVHLAEAAVATLRPALSVQLFGQLRFAEAVAGFAPVVGPNGPSACVLVPDEALGAPDYIQYPSQCCPPIITTVTLGPGGVLVLEFSSASISGDGTPEPDLWIYERGPDVEDTYVDLSADGVSWEPAGKVFGAVSAVDLDALGFGPLDLFRYVRLTDDPFEGQVNDCTAGADIDAVAAIAPNPWVSLGHALAGSAGKPTLSAAGPLVANGGFQIAIAHGKPLASATLVLGLSQLDAPFKGGTMVPFPNVLVPGLPLGASGAITLPATWPAGVPAGLPVCLQAWIPDAAGPKGFAATNAIKTATQ